MSIETQPTLSYIQAPDDTYWVFTKKGATLFQTRPLAVVNKNPYLVPSHWVDEGLVILEELE